MGDILEQVLEAPQRSPPVPDASGQFALYSESTHSLSEHKTSAKFGLLETQTGKTFDFPSDPESKHFVWIEPTKIIIWQKSVGNDTELWTCSASDLTARHRVGSFKGSAVLLQAVQLSNGDIGTLYYSEKLTGESNAWPRSSARVFTKLPCSTFDQGVAQPRYSLYYLRIAKAAQTMRQDSKDGPNNGELIDVLRSTELEFFPYSGSMPNISTPNCSISASGIAFVARQSSDRTSCDLSAEAYFAPLRTDSEVPGEQIHISTGTCNGWPALPVFSRDGNQLAFARDDDKSMILIDRSIIVAKDICSKPKVTVVQLRDENGGRSALYPESVQWGPDGKSLYFMACSRGQYKMFGISADAKDPIPEVAAPLEGRGGSVLSAHIRGDGSGPGSCLLTETSFTSPNRLHTLDLQTMSIREVPNQDVKDFGLSPEQVSETTFRSDGRDIHTYIIRPSNFDASKKYPMALAIHGGPIAAWVHAFHLYWTLPVFAEHGYVLVLPNFTGSTGYSRDFRLAAYGDFGDKPYHDLEACMDYVASDLPYVDVNRAVSLGGSYGGYMNLWLAGQPLAKRFKALILHACGGFGNTSFYMTDCPELYTRIMVRADEKHETDDIERCVARWDPTPYAKNWTTPMLFTHGEKDNRCPTANSLAAFAHCQIKGVESKLVVFPDESHFILKPDNSYHWHKEIFEWMDRYTKV